MIWEKLDKHRDLGLLIARIGFGFGFIYFHGWGKLTGGVDTWGGIGGAMGNLGITFLPVFWGFLQMLAETLFALFIAIGFLYRPACAILAFGMFVASLNHIVTGRGSPGHPLKYMFIAAGFMLIGPGKYSVDAWLAARKRGAG